MLLAYSNALQHDRSNLFISKGEEYWNQLLKVNVVPDIQP